MPGDPGVFADNPVIVTWKSPNTPVKEPVGFEPGIDNTTVGPGPPASVSRTARSARAADDSPAIERPITTARLVMALPRHFMTFPPDVVTRTIGQGIRASVARI